MTVSELLALYLRHCAIESIHSPEARADRERVFRDFLAAHGDMAVSECKAFHLTDFVEANPRWRSVSTRRAKANYLRAAFAWAADGERIGRNPFRAVRYQEAERRPDMPDDVLTVLEKVSNGPFALAVRFLRWTGCRLSELCQATWDQFDLERGVWVIQRHKSRKKTGKPKVVALVSDAVELLRSVAHVANPGDRVFVNNCGRPWTRKSLGQHLRYLKRRHGIDTPATLHGIRHRFGSCGVAAGAPIKLIAQQLGHHSVQVTERYYVDLTREIEAMRAAAQLAQR